MTTETLAPDRAADRGADLSPRWRVTRARHVLLALWLILGLGLAVEYEQQTSLADLYAAAQAGEIGSVRLTPGLGDNATGSAIQEVHWRQGWLKHKTTVVARSPGLAVPASARAGAEATTDDVGVELLRRDADIRLVQIDWPSSSVEIVGQEVGGWLMLPLFIVTVGPFILLAVSRQPWRATRWAWFWILLIPFGSLAFVLLSGPTRGLPTPRESARRVTGGWAFLLTTIVMSTVGS